MAKKCMKTLMLVIIMEVLILIPMEVQVNDYVLALFIALQFPSTIYLGHSTILTFFVSLVPTQLLLSNMM
jgi:hypothetical protein